MPLMLCRECRKQISTEAKACPHCGAPDPAFGGKDIDDTARVHRIRRNRVIAIACFGVVGLFALLLILGSLAPEDPLAGICGATQAAVRERLRSPSTATFVGGCRITGDTANRRYGLIGEVDAQNAFGATIRSAWAATVTGRPEAWHVEWVEIR